MKTQLSLELMARSIADEMAPKLAKLLADELRGDELVDHRASPLGPRRHIAAIREGKLPGFRKGRQWLAKRSDIEAFIWKRERGTAQPLPPSNKEPDLDVLARELGFRKTR